MMERKTMPEPLIEQMINNHISIRFYATLEPDKEKLEQALNKQDIFFRTINIKLNQHRDILREIV